MKRLELLAGIGAAVLGAGVALLFAEWLAPFAVPALVIGTLAHGWAMFAKYRIESRTAPILPAWETITYWLCWLMLAGLFLYVAAN